MNKKIEKFIESISGIVPTDIILNESTNGKTYCVYEHITPNGKRYIGITSKKPTNRWGPNGKGYSDQIVFAGAIKKYGWNNIKHNILITGLTEAEALFLEEYLIDYYDLTNRKCGYNMLSGGKNPPATGHPKKVICLNTLEIFNSVQEAERKNNICKGRVSTVCKNKAKWAGVDKDGYNLRWEYYDPNKEYIKINGEYIGPSKPVICISTLEIFNSIEEAGKEKNISPGCIKNCCEGNALYAGEDIKGNGLLWEFYNPSKKYSVKILSKEEVQKGRFRGELFKNRPVICLNTLKVYNSIAEAGKDTGTDRTHISDVCKGFREYAGVDIRTGRKLKWSYFNPEKQYVQVRGQTKRRILCIETNKVYPSIKYVMEDTGFKKSSIYTSCYTNTPLFGFHFQFITE